jgi:predicted nucleotidyltransferase
MVAMNDIAEFSRRVAEEFDPEKIILFGSHAYGTPTKDSDVDILVIMPFEGRWLHKSVEILSRLDPEFAIDLITRRPDEVQQRYKNRDPLIREALDHGKVLYERRR